MKTDLERNPHGGIQAALDYVIDRLALASEVGTTAQVSVEETESLFTRFRDLTDYASNNSVRDSD